jgi:hypothetical protein
LNFSKKLTMSTQSKSRAKKKKAVLNGTTRRRWTTDDQLAFLNEHLPDYMTAQSQPGQKAFEDFWPQIYQMWFDQWPISRTAEQIEDGIAESDLMAAQKVVSYNISNWLSDYSYPLSTAPRPMV